VSEEIWATFRAGLTITGVGMALVFLTLILIAVVIKALDRLFQARSGAEVKDDESAEDQVVQVVAVAEVAVGDVVSQVAAIAAALALQAHQVRPVLAVAPAGMATAAMLPLPWQAVADVDDEEITGEVITVAGIAGSASWKARGRLDGLK
jgi:sodium pump decarboxylase gamma subunit